jgi:replication initiation protein RepC
MDDMNDAHIYSTNQTQFDKSNLGSHEDKTASRGSVAAPSGTIDEDPACGEAGEGKTAAEIAEEIGKITWKQVINAASDRFTSYFPHPGKARDFHDIVDAAYALLPVLGIHKSAWHEACAVLGRNGAAICVMIIDQKAQDPQLKIRNPGGYLREMTARAKRGELNLHGSVFGLLKRGERKHDA